MICLEDKGLTVGSEIELAGRDQLAGENLFGGARRDVEARGTALGHDHGDGHGQRQVCVVLPELHHALGHVHKPLTRQRGRLHGAAAAEDVADAVVERGEGDEVGGRGTVDNGLGGLRDGGRAALKALALNVFARGAHEGAVAHCSVIHSDVCCRCW